MIEKLNIRQLAEEREESLSPHAARSKASQGRQRPEEPCPVRTAFQRDRDRIIHSKSFRRLKHKTQVFIAPLGDHYVTRLTHTLEVAQIARTIARALNLNEDLAEAISLGHDLGHTPFGHIGEAVLDELYHKGFRHNEQSLRIVDHLENNGRGLNLTWEVRDGILSHSKTNSSIMPEENEVAGTLEGEICQDVRIALGAVAPTPIRATKAEKILKGVRLEDSVVQQAARTAAEESQPISDIRSSAEYRTEMVKVLTKRAIKEASKRIRGTP